MNETPLMRMVRALTFILIFFVLFSAVSGMLARKSLAKPWDMSVKVGGFYNEPKDSFDTMFFGSSHMYCSVDPVQLEELTGRRSYILATQEQPLWFSYYYMLEALKTQKPDTMVLEVNMVTQKELYAEEGTNYSALDPITFSRNKIDMVRAAVPKGEQRNYLFNIFKYHGRWEELELEDYKQTYREKTDAHHGYVKLLEVHPLEEAVADISGVTDVKEPLEKNMDYLKKICDLAEEENIRLVLMKSPSNPGEEDQLMYNAVWQLAEERNIPYADFNRGISCVDHDHASLDVQEIGLDKDTDYYDQHHLNFNGVIKFTPVFAQFLQKQAEDSTMN